MAQNRIAHFPAQSSQENTCGSVRGLQDAGSKTAANADRGIFPIFLKSFSGYRVPVWEEKWKDRQCNANLEGMDNYGAVHDREGTNLARSTEDTIAVDTVSVLESVLESSDSSLGFMNEKKQKNKLTNFSVTTSTLEKRPRVRFSFFRFFLNRTVPPQLIEDWFFNELMTHSTWRNERLTIIFFFFFQGKPSKRQVCVWQASGRVDEQHKLSVSQSIWFAGGWRGTLFCW